MQSNLDASLLSELLSNSIGSASASLPPHSNGLTQSGGFLEDQPMSAMGPFGGHNSLIQLFQKQHKDEQQRILLSQQLSALEGAGIRGLRSTDIDQQNTATLLLLLHQQQQQQKQQQQQLQLQLQQQQRLQQLRVLVQFHEANSLSTSMSRSMCGIGGQESVDIISREVKHQMDTSSQARSRREIEMHAIPPALQKVDKTKPGPAAETTTSDERVHMPLTQTIVQKSKGKGRTGKFPQKLHQMLMSLELEAGGSDIASFLPDGWSFAIHNQRDFANLIMPKYFRMSRFSSFQRQLNLYDFQRKTTGKNKGAYYHQLFKRESPELCNLMKRSKIKGIRNPSNTAKAAKKEAIDDESDVGDDDISAE